MLVRVVGIVMMLDGVMSAMAALPMVNTFVYRGFRDQSLVIAHFLIGALLVLSGRLLFAGQRAENQHREFFSRNNSRCYFLGGATLVVGFVIACIETTRFNWPALALRAGYTVFALAVLYRTTLPKT